MIIEVERVYLITGNVTSREIILLNVSNVLYFSTFTYNDKHKITRVILKESSYELHLSNNLYSIKQLIKEAHNV